MLAHAGPGCAWPGPGKGRAGPGRASRAGTGRSGGFVTWAATKAVTVRCAACCSSISEPE